MIIIKYTYLKSVEEIDKIRKEHLAFLEKIALTKKFILGGRTLDSTGAFGLFNLNNKDEVKAIVKNDPYVLNEAVKYELFEFEPKVISEDFKKLLTK